MREWLLECFPDRGDDRGLGKGACTTELVEDGDFGFTTLGVRVAKWLERHPKGVVQVILCDEGGEDGS